MRFFLYLAKCNLKKLCQHPLLLAQLLLFYAILPVGIGFAAQSLLSDGVSFSNLTLAITAPEGDPTAQQIAQLTGNMSDIRQYCTFVAMDQESAMKALEENEVTAILALPERFLR